ncbi:hydroxymethylbilane synthase [Fulvivirgaceae bacterium BMA10]|uniref:Porphobilinogen deaminase n=1 Tax=Splendidivirga corallicola TaxID=3051826 RepID=A0ABT8KZ46_9BACT|nr:hydroxymethylbilane synthase [Fulvivirgaceae bacterium BMA10]
MKIRIGTRGSKLALWQAHHVSDKLQKAGIETEIITIETTGDKILDVSISKIGSKGVFTEEIEEQLISGNIDIAVHSAKDMQSVLPEGFKLIAFGEREVANDVLLSHKANLNIEDNLVIGTSSTRRIAFFKHYYPHLKTVPVRGNLQTRIRKMKEGACDALLLAYAGVHRMGYEDMIVQKLHVDQIIPAVGQGSIAIECAHALPKEKQEVVRNTINHTDTEVCLLAERAYLKKLEGGCSIPVFGMARLENDLLSLTGGIISLNGEEIIRKNVKKSKNDPELIGAELAEMVLNDGGEKILKEIKEQLK